MIFSSFPVSQILEGMRISCINPDAVKAEYNYFFSCRVISVWNSLPDSVSFKSLRSFRHTIKNVDLTRFLQCFY